MRRTEELFLESETVGIEEEEDLQELTTQPHSEGEAVIELLWPDWRQKPMREGELRRASTALREVLATGELDLERIAELCIPVVVPGEIVGRALLENGEGDGVVQAGPYVTRSAAGEYRAERYGYLSLIDDELSVQPPLWIDPEGMAAHWLLLDEGPQAVTREMLLERLADLEVVEGIKGRVIQALCAQATAGKHACGAVLIAAGTAPENGEDARVEILVDTQRTAGKEREDGSIDFREVNFAANVRAGQAVARRTPPTKGVPGRDVRGRILEAADGENRSLKPGENVEVKVEQGIELFYATVTGALREDDQIAVTRLLHIDGDVDFKTGNLDFEGEICVQGSVVQGFAIKATRNITITDTVEPGARVTAGRNLTVGRGVVGRKTRATAKGTIRAQFVQEATLAAGRDILLGNYAYQARLRAGRWVRIAKGEGKRGGSLIGGQLWAHAGVEAHIIGSGSHAPILLMAGVSPQHVQQLDKLKESVDLTYNQLRRRLGQFGLARVDVEQIKNMIAAAIGPRRKLLVNKARQVGQVAQSYQKLVASRQQLEEKITREMQGAQIRAHEKAFPGVEIRLGEHRRKLEEEVASPCFHVVDGHLVNR